MTAEHTSHSVLVLWREICRMYSGDVIPYEVAEAKNQLLSLEEQLEAAMDCMNYAWTIICNVSEGDWTKQRQEWQDAAAKCREQYHALLDANQVRRIERAVITSTDQHGNPSVHIEESSPASSPYTQAATGDSPLRKVLRGISNQDTKQEDA